MSTPSDAAGLGLALGCSVLFGLYMAPRKMCAMGSMPFLLTMVIGVVITLSIIFAATGRTFEAAGTDVALSVSCGTLWTLGTLFFVLGVTRMGLATSTTIKNTTAVWGALVGIVLFNEGAQTDSATCVAGSVLIAGSAGCLGATGDGKGAAASISIPGVVYSLLASLAYAGYTVPLKVVRGHGVSFVETVFYMGLGAAVTGLAIFAACDRRFGAWWRRPPRDHAWAAISGVLWSLAVLTMTEAIEVVGLAVTWPIANLNTVFAIALGVWVFHEVDLKRHGRLLSLGVGMAVAGVALLGLSRTLR